MQAPVSAQPLTGEGLKERNEGCKQNTSGHNLDWGPGRLSGGSKIEAEIKRMVMS